MKDSRNSSRCGTVFAFVLGQVCYWTRSRLSECGQILIMWAVGLPILLGMMGLSVDVGMLMHTKTQLQAAVDSAALAGAYDLPMQPSAASSNAIDYAGKNDKVGLKPADQLSNTVKTTYATNDTITVSATRTVDTFFIRVLGILNSNVQAKATAINAPAGGVAGVIPWAVNNDAFFSYGAYVSLQSVGGSGGSGQFNFASLNPPGGQTYQDAMANGTSQPILAGGSYATNTFDGSSVSTQTANSLNARITARPGETWTTIGSGSPRVVFIPIVNGNMPNAPNPVLILTFRAFFLERVDTANNAIWGRFVQFTPPTATIGVGVPDQGVRVIKLISDSLGGGTPVATSTAAPTSTPVPATSTPTPTATPPGPTATPTRTPTSPPGPTATPTRTPSGSTATPTRTQTRTPTPCGNNCNN